MPVLCGRKTESEKFAGALRTYAIEALMGDGKALQAGTSHNLGQHFATAYGIEFLDQHAAAARSRWSTSWGTSTRLIGGAHHDPRRRLGARPAAEGGALPGRDRAHPAPQGRLERGGPAEGPRGRRPCCVGGIRVAPRRPRPVPARLQVRRLGDARGAAAARGGAQGHREGPVRPRAPRQPGEGVRAARRPGRRACSEILAAMQKDLLEKARAFVAANTTRVATYDEFKEAMAEKRGFIVAGWNGDPAIEARIKEETKATIRVIPMGDPPRRPASSPARKAARSSSHRRTDARPVRSADRPTVVSAAVVRFRFVRLGKPRGKPSPVHPEALRSRRATRDPQSQCRQIPRDASDRGPSG